MPLWRAMLGFLLPLIASNLLQSFSTTISAIYYGQMIGVAALAVSATFFPLVFFLLSFLLGFANAAAILIGQAFGAGDPARARRIAGTALTICFLSGTAIAVACGLNARAILDLMGTPPDIMADALTYSRVMFAFMPLLFAFVAYTTLLRGVGDTRSPLLALLVSSAISLTLAPALIRGWFGLPMLGIVSGPCAAAIAYAVSLIWLAGYLRRRKSPLAPDRRLLAALRVDWILLRKLLQLGLPSGAQLVLIALSEIAVIAFVNAFGSDATAAYGAVNQIVSYVQFPAVSVGVAASIFAAQAIGGARAQQLPQIARTAIGLSLAIEGSVILLVYLFSGPIVGWFIAAPATAAIAQRLIWITLWSYLVFSASQALQGVMRGTGTVLWPTALSIGSIWLLEVPVAYFLSHRIGITGVWIAYPCAFIGGLALQAAYYSGVWRKRVHVRLV
jgi:putative MATE family efflux protein